MIRNHSFISTVKEILATNVTTDVVKINCIGPPSSGKSTASELIAHLIHKESREPCVVKKLTRKELLDMENTMSTFEPLNHAIIFDDVSWLKANSNNNKIEQLLKTFSEIRHLPGGQDVKIFIIFNFHYNFAIPKALRQADFFYYFDIGSSELENMDKVVGVKNRNICTEFIRVKNQIKSTSKPATDTEPEYKGNFSYPIGKMGFKFTYQHRDPFAPALFWNLDTLRHVVFPKRDWLDPYCITCGSDKNKPKGDIEKLKLHADKSYGSAVPIALRIIAYRRGINVWTERIDRAVKWLERELITDNYPLEDVINAYGLERPTTIINKKSIKQQEEEEKNLVV